MGTVTIYLADVAHFSDCEDKLMHFVPDFRKKKAAAYKKREARLLSLCGGLMLKKVLSVDNENQIEYNTHGKPFLKNGRFFSLSHSGAYSVLVADDDVIGIDIERIRDRKAHIEDRVCTTDEKRLLSKNHISFFELWTRKEAILKALGTGLYIPMHSFSVINDLITIEEQSFFLKTMPIEKNYFLSVASKTKNEYMLQFLSPGDIL